MHDQYRRHSLLAGVQVQAELITAEEQAASAASAFLSPLRRHREDSGGGQASASGGARVALNATEHRPLYAPLYHARSLAHGAAADVASVGHHSPAAGVCHAARAAYNGSFQFEVHGTAHASVDGAPSLSDWLQWPQPAAGTTTSTEVAGSRTLYDAMHSPAMETFIASLLGSSRGTEQDSSSGPVASSRLRPILQATAYHTGDYLTVHNDLHQHAAGGRRLALIAQFSSVRLHI